MERRAPAALRRRGRRRGRAGDAPDRVPHGGRRGRPAQAQRPARAPARRQPARVRPRPRPCRVGGADAARRRAHEGAQHQRGPDVALPAASPVPRAVRRARALRDRRVRSRDARLLRARLAPQPVRRPALGGRVRGPHAAHRRARQEPRERDPVVARERERQRPQPLGDGALGARARPVPAAALRARLVVPRRRRLQPHVRRPCRGRRDRAARGGAARRPLSRRAPAPRAAVHPVRVRARDGQRAGRAVGVPGAVRAPPALPGRVRVGVDRPRPAPAHARRRRAVRLRRRLRRAAARRQLRRRRPALPRPHAVPGAARVQEGDRARPDRGRRRGGCA